MSASAFGHTPAEPAQEFSLWVTTHLDRARRSYVVVLSPSQDLERLPKDQIRELTAAGALQWTRVLLEAAATAEHDAAVLSQMRSLGLADDVVVQLVHQLRQDRADERRLPATAGYAVRPSTTLAGEPFMTLLVDDVPRGQWTPLDARTHALHVQQCVAAADLDGAYWRALVDTIGVEPDRAANVIANLREHQVRPSAKKKGRRR